MGERRADNEATVHQQGGPAEIRQLIAQGASRAQARMVALDQLALQASALATMDYDFLFDKVRRVGRATGDPVLNRWTLALP